MGTRIEKWNENAYLYNLHYIHYEGESNHPYDNDVTRVNSRVNICRTE